MATLNELKKEVFDYVNAMLGAEMVDVELDSMHYEQAIKQAMIRYRQRSTKALEESFAFLDLEADVNQYTMPEEILSIRRIFRRSIGSTTTSSATMFEPFEAGFLNMYLLQSGRIGGLLNYELFAQYQELSSRMFGGYMNYHYNAQSHQLTLHRRPRSNEETVLLWTYNYKPDVALLSDYMIVPWIREYTLALAKIMLGEAREKFASIAGPQGGTSLNGGALKSEGRADIERMENELNLYMDGADPLSFIIG